MRLQKRLAETLAAECRPDVKAFQFANTFTHGTQTAHAGNLAFDLNKIKNPARRRFAANLVYRAGDVLQESACRTTSVTEMSNRRSISILFQDMYSTLS